MISAILLLIVGTAAQPDNIPYDPALAVQRQRLINLQADIEDCLYRVAKAQLTFGNRSRNSIETMMMSACRPRYVLELVVLRIPQSADDVQQFLDSAAVLALELAATQGQ